MKKAILFGLSISWIALYQTTEKANAQMFYSPGKTLKHENIIERLEHITNKNSQMIKLSSVDDKKYLLDSAYSFSFISLNDSVQSEKNNFMYDSAGNKINELSFSWNNLSGRWTGNYQYEYEYDSQNNNLKFIKYHWVDTMDQWSKNEVYDNTYNSKGMKTVSIESLCQWNDCYEMFKYEYVYNFSDNKISDKTYIIANKWQNYNKTDYTLDSLGSIFEETYSLWDNLSNQWLWNGSYRYDYTYNSNNKYTYVILSYLNYYTSQWIEYATEEFTYDLSGNEISHLYSMWDNTVNQIVNTDKFVYGYDPLNNKISELVYTWDNMNDQWILVNKKYYYYSWHDVVSDYKSLSSVILPKLFPNPAWEKVTIEIPDESVKQIIFYNMNGQPVISSAIKTGKNIYDLRNLNKGVYLIHLLSGKTVYKLKMIKY
jgi:hypothetical protein